MADQFEAAYPGTCTTALPLHEATYGPPPPGTTYECVEVSDAGGFPAALVYIPVMPATYLLQVEHSRGAGAGSATVEDVAVTTHHWRWDGATPPLGTDFEIIEARMDGFWTGIASLRPTGIVVTGYRWYLEPRVPGVSSPSLRTTLKNIAGTSVAVPLPAQISATVTEMTDVRRRWGRFYVPGLGSNASRNDGMMQPTAADLLANTARTQFMHSAANWRLVVHGSLEPRSLEVRDIRVDNVFDIQRSRRPDRPSYRKQVSLTP